MRDLFRYLSPFKKRMALGLSIKTVGTFMDLVIPYILAHIIDRVAPSGNMKTVMLWGLIMIISSVIAVSFNIIANRMASRVACDTILKIRHDLFSKISYLSLKSVDKFTIASLESRLTSDTYNVHHFTGAIQRLGVRAPILLVGGIIVTLSLDPVLTLVMLATLPFIGALTVFISKKGVPLFRKVQEKTDGFTRVVREDASGIRVIKALSKINYEKERFDKANRDAIETEKKAGLTMAIINPLMTLFLNVGLTAVILVGAYRVNGGLTGAGTIIAFMSYFTIISNAIISISRMFAMYSRASASMTRISEVLSEPSEYSPDDEKIKENGHTPDEHAPFIEFRNVSFSYGSTSVIKNVSFSLKKGESLGIIGSTGSGKTTIINLLMRFYEPCEGDIFIDGINIKRISPKHLRRRFGVVFQNDFLFADKISENIKFGREVSDDELNKAISLSQAEGFISSYPDGAEHPLDIKGANLSGGQKQRVLIARALASDPEILVLDDSSSALDYKTDALLRRAVEANFSHTTKITIAQRVSSIKHADLILVVENGEILAMGNHNQLMESCPEYAEISNSQMGGMLVD